MRAHVGAGDRPEVRRQALQGLVQMGWSSAVARSAMAAAEWKLGAVAELDDDALLERLLVEAVRACPRPRGTT